MPTPDPVPFDPEASMIRKVLKSGVVEKLVPLLVSALLGGVAGTASRQVGDAQHGAAEEETRTKALAVEADLKEFKAKYYERLRTNRERSDADHAALEKEQHANERYLERRLTRIETRLGIEAPPAAAAAPAAGGPP